MNKYFSLLLICSGSVLYAQNPPETSMFEKNLTSANELYQGLTEDEKKFCDFMPRQLAVSHVRALRDENKLNLIPAEISPEEDDNVIDTNAGLAVLKLGENPTMTLEKYKLLAAIGAIRISAPFKRQADLVGEKSTWGFFNHQNFDDPNYLVIKAENQSQD